MSEFESERITSTEGGQSRLLRTQHVLEMLSDQDVLDDDLWWTHQVIKDGRLPAQNIWYEVERLRKVSFSDGAIPVEGLQKQLVELQTATEDYYRQSVQSELEEVNRFLTSRPNLFIVGDTSDTVLRGMSTKQEQTGIINLFSQYSDETVTASMNTVTYIDTTQLTTAEQQAIVQYRHLYET